jgi:uncharacterized protein (TIGR01440 family)
MDAKKVYLEGIKEEWESILKAFGEATEIKPGQLVVLGCSTSEILGQRIGKASSKEIADVLIDPILNWADQMGVYPVFQCCEHLNRTLVVEKECAEKFGLEPVSVVPALSAGGAMAVAAWDKLSEPAAVESVKAHAGIDIGDTFIGMHLRSVVVPVRINVNTLGSAHITFAKTRPKYVGGPRAVYSCS